MTISFLILVNKQGQTRLAKYFGETLNTDEKRALEGEIVRKCLARTDKQCSFFDHRQYKVVYRRYASLFFMVGVDDEEVSQPRARSKLGCALGFVAPASIHSTMLQHLCTIISCATAQLQQGSAE